MGGVDSNAPQALPRPQHGSDGLRRDRPLGSDGSLNQNVAQLTNVACPKLTTEERYRARVDVTLAEIRGSNQVTRKRRDVPRALAERRHIHDAHRDAFIEVGAETTILHHTFEGFARRHHEPNVDGLPFLCTERATHLVLDDTQELGLNVAAEGPEFIEK